METNSHLYPVSVSNLRFCLHIQAQIHWSKEDNSGTGNAEIHIVLE